MSDSLRRSAVGLLLGLLPALAAAAPQSPSAPQAAPPPRFGTGTQVVVLDLIVRDAKGRPVHDLRQDEVRVTEDGAGCEILSLRRIEAQVESSDVGTEAKGSRPKDPRIVVLAFDRLGPEAARRAGRAAIDWLSSPLPEGTLFTVYQLGAGLQRLQPLTSDRAAVADSIRKRLSRAGESQDTPVGAEAGAPTSMLTDEAVKRLSGQPASRQLAPGEIDGAALYFWDRASRVQRAQASLGALRAIVDALGLVEGRKVVVFFSEGFHTPTQSESELRDETISTANRANVAFYTIDATGLTLERRDVGAWLEPGEQQPVTPDTPGALEDFMAAGPQANLRLLSSMTGGFVTTSTERLSPALARVAQDIGSYYEVVYTPQRPEPDGRFHRTSAHVSRPGVRVRTRAGYYANGASLTVAATEWPLVEALGATQPRHEFDSRTTALYFGGESGGRDVVVLTEVPLAGVQLSEDPSRGRYRGRLTALVRVSDQSGRLVSRMSHEAPLSGPLAERSRRQVARLLLRRTLRLEPGAYTIESAVRDEESGRVSVSQSELLVPAVRAGLSASSLALVQRTETAPAENDADPLLMGRVAIVPTPEPLRVDAVQPAVGYFARVYVAPGSAAPAAALEIRQHGELKAQATPRLPEPDVKGGIAYLGRVPLDRLAPGSYELVLSVTNGSGSATSRAAFELPVLDAGTSEATGADRGPTVAEPGSTVAGPPSTTGDPELDALLQRAATYVREYSAVFQNVVAEEDYRQGYSDGVAPAGYGPAGAASGEPGVEAGPSGGRTRRRRTRADLVFVRLAGAIPWASFRDVYEVDGVPVRDHERRLAEIFQSDAEGAVETGRRLVRESARYNIGSTERTLNVPTLPLLFLDAANQGRFVFTRAAPRQLAGTATVEVRYAEKARPTLFHEGTTGGDLPVEGSFWIEPSRGTVLRSILRFRFPQGRGTGRVTADYRREPGLQMFVPSEMAEVYEDRHSGGMRDTDGTTTAVARYSNYRRFTVTTEERASPKPSEP